MKIEAKITISRNSRDEISIALVDEASGLEFVDVQMSLEDFAKCITGHSRLPANGDVRGLEHVGKQRIRETRRVHCPLTEYNRGALTQWLVDECQEEGWILDPYLDSQNSVSYSDNGCHLNYAVIKYVPAGDL